MPATPAGYNLFAYCYFDAIDYPGCGLAAPSHYGVYFSKKGFSGTAMRLKAGGSPASINTPGDEIFGQKPREAQFSLTASATFHLADFFSNNDRDFFVTIDRVTTDSVPQPVLDGNVFAGWLSPFEAKEPYAHTPYPVEVSAVDGLGSLADYPFYQYPSGTPYAGTITLIDALITALAWTGFHLPIYSSFHLAEESFWGMSSLGTPQHPGPHNDFFANVKANVSRWKNDDGSWQSCKQVIDDIIGPNARLCQVNGAWRIMRLPELPGVSDFQGNYGYTRSWVVYDTGLSGQTVVGFVQEDPRVTVYKANDAVPLSGANLAIRRNEPRVKITFDYGAAPDVLVNGSMLGSPGQVPQGWTVAHQVGDNAGPHDSGITAAGNCVIIAADDNYPSRVRVLGMKNGDPKRTFQNDYRNLFVLQQSIYVPVKTGSQCKITLSGIYDNHLTGGGAVELVAEIGFLNPQGVYSPFPLLVRGALAGIPIFGSAITPDHATTYSYALQSSGSWSSKLSGDTVNYLHFLNLLPDGVGNGKNYQLPKPTNGEPFSVDSEAVPLDGFTFQPAAGNTPVIKFTLTLWPGPDYDTPASHAGCYTDYWNLKISVGEATLVDLSKEEIYAEVPGLTPRDRKRTTELPTRLGYQTTAYASPPKAVRPGCLLKLNGQTPIGRAMTTSGHIDKVQNLDARERVEMLGKQRNMYDGPKLTDANPLSVLYLPELGGLYMLPINHKWKLRERSVEGRDIELPGTIDRLTDPLLTGNYLTKDGVVYPMGTASIAGPGGAVTPTVPGIHAPFDRIGDIIKKLTTPIKPRFGTPGETPAPLPGIGNIIKPGFIKHG